MIKKNLQFFKKTLCLVLIICCSSSCTVLQWRSTDAEIKAYFEEKQIPTVIDYFDIDSLDLKIRVQHIRESDTDINLVFFHGSPSSLSAWNGYMNDSSFVKNAVVHAVDRPGYGYSNFGNEITSIDLQAKIMSDLLDHYQLDNVIAVGSSYGGPLVARMAYENDRVKGVVMISPAIDPDNEKKIWQSKLTQWWITRWLCPTGYRVAGDEKTVHAQELAAIAPDWKDVTVPVLHIHGDVDDIVPYENINYTRTAFKNIEIITIPDTGHEIAWARPDLIKPMIIKFMDSIFDKEDSKTDRSLKN